MKRRKLSPETELRLRYCAEKIRIPETAVLELAANLFYDLLCAGIIQANPTIIPAHLLGQTRANLTHPIHLNLDVLPE